MAGQRRITFEVYVCLEERWLLQTVAADEDEAVRLAKRQLGETGVEGVRVVRQNETPGGSVFSTTIFEEESQGQRDTPLQVTGDAEGAPDCDDAEDFYGFAARLVLGRLLRQFLEKHQITATELLHSWPYIRRLTDTGTLVAAAVYKVAAVQGERRGVPIRERFLTLNTLIDGVINRARVFGTDRSRQPTVTLNTWVGTAGELRLKLPADEADFIIAACLSLSVLSGPLMNKVDQVLTLIDNRPDPDTLVLLDGVLADALMIPEVVREVFGPQPHRAALLCRFADLLHGRDFPSGSPMTAPLKRMAPLIRGRRLGQTAGMVQWWLERELKADRPWDRRNPDEDNRLFEEVLKALRGADNRVLGGEAVEVAINRQKLLQRQKTLRQMGMHEAAAALARNWPPPRRRAGDQAEGDDRTLSG